MDPEAREQLLDEAAARHGHPAGGAEAQVVLPRSLKLGLGWLGGAGGVLGGWGLGLGGWEGGGVGGQGGGWVEELGGGGKGYIRLPYVGMAGDGGGLGGWTGVGGRGKKSILLMSIGRGFISFSPVRAFLNGSFFKNQPKAKLPFAEGSGK